MSSIQFSYPQMSIEKISGADNNKKFKVVAGGGGYFDLYYNNTVLHFIPSEISFIKGDMQYMIINHSSTSNSLIIRFKIVESDDAKTGITENSLYINKLIGDGLEAGKIKFNTNVSIKKKKDDGNYYVIDFTDCGTIPIQKLKEDIKNGGTWPDTDTGTNKIALKSNSFATDEIVCDEGTINSVADKTKKSYEAKVAGNVGLSFGLGFLVLTAVVFGITKWKPTFNTGTEWFDGWKQNNIYMLCLMFAFLLSFSCFMGYGGVLSSGSGDKTADLTGLLWTAIVSFLIFVFMVGYKMVVLTKSAAAPAAPAAP